MASASTTKAALRREILARRRDRGDAARGQAAEKLRQQVGTLPQLRGPVTVAAYVAGPGEPETRPLLRALLAPGTTVLLPVLRPDFDLDWAAVESLADLTLGRFGIHEPTTKRLGVAAVTAAGVVLCPGLAGDHAGHRLGRGGGSYDRVLSRLAPATLRCLLLYDDEVLAELPTDPHDQLVDLIVTPTRVLTTDVTRPAPG